EGDEGRRLAADAVEGALPEPAVGAAHLDGKPAAVEPECGRRQAVPDRAGGRIDVEGDIAEQPAALVVAALRPAAKLGGLDDEVRVGVRVQLGHGDLIEV